MKFDKELLIFHFKVSNFEINFNQKKSESTKFLSPTKLSFSDEMKCY